MKVKARMKKQDEWFDESLIKYADAREMEIMNKKPFSSGLARQISSLECSIIRYNYIYKTRPFDEPLSNDDPENLDDCLSANLMNDLYSKIDFQGKPYQKYIAPFIDND